MELTGKPKKDCDLCGRRVTEGGPWTLHRVACEKSKALEQGQMRGTAEPLPNPPEGVMAYEARMAARKTLNNLELTSVILQWLKYITLEEQSITFEDDTAPETPKTWTDTFARLATVNKAFFDASIGVLWERLTSLEPPFGYVLPADKDKDGIPSRPLSYQFRKVTLQHWERFKLYTSKTKVLVLDKASPGINSGWLYHLLDSTARPSTFFPSVRRIFLLTPKALTLYVANNCTPVVQFVEMNLHAKSMSDARDNGRALTAGFYQNARALTELRITNKITGKMLDSIARIESLEALHIVIGSDVEWLHLDKLGQLPHLKQLCIDQGLDPEDRTVVSTFPAKIIDARSLKAKSKLRHLQELRVVANGATQYRIAMALLPCNLEGLTLLLISDAMNIQTVLIPLIIGIYVNRNPSLVRLTVETSKATQHLRANPESLAPLRQDIQYNDLEPFLQGIASLRNLTSLRIIDIPFLADDILPRLLVAVQDLSLLKLLVIKPDNITDLEVDYLELPSWEVLESIAIHHPCLERLGILFEVDQDVPPLPAIDSMAPEHKLIDLEFFEDFGNVENRHTEDNKFAIARYLERVFPHVNIDTEHYEDGECKDLWAFIDRLLRFSRESRAQAIRQLEMARSKE